MNLTSWRFELIIIFLIFTFLILLYCCKQYIKRLGRGKENNCQQVLSTIKGHLEKDKSDDDVRKSHASSLPAFNKSPIKGSRTLDDEQTIDQPLSLMDNHNSEQMLYSLPIRLSSNSSIHTNDKYLTNIMSHKTKEITTDLEHSIHTVPSTPSCAQSINENSRI